MNNNAQHQIITPLIDCLTNETFEFMRDQAGFPVSWSKFMVSMWLGSVFDRVSFITVTTPDNVVQQIVTQYPNIYDENNYIQLCIPVNGFDCGYMEYIHQELANIDFNSYDGWLQYINRGGNDRFNIRLRRYNDDNIIVLL